MSRFSIKVGPARAFVGEVEPIWVKKFGQNFH